MSDGVKLTCLHCGQANRVPQARLADGAKCATCGAALLPGKPVETDFATLQKAIRTDGMPLLTDFWAPWCGPCRSMAPEFAKAAGEMKTRVRFAKVNTEQDPAASQKLQIRGIPALIMFRNGAEAGRLAGARPASSIIEFAKQAGGVVA
ncbi:MAG: thioredoxin TrxC [Deltaproteobacteria bacterium]